MQNAETVLGVLREYHGINHWRARCGETRTAGLVGGRTEKDLHRRHLAVRPTHPVKVAGRWVYLYRAIDQCGQVIDVLISQKRDLAATRRFFTGVLEHGLRPLR